MRKALLAGALIAACLVVCSERALAHHGGGAYDAAHPLTVTGTVKDFQFIQPHPLITLEVKDDQGAVTEWSVEMTAPNHLVHYGWNGKKLKPGDQVTVTGLPSKNGLKVMNLRKISWANGQEIPLGPPPEPGQ
jgi:DNA/RNA endonuclease YhcR with UshA esterase domain